MECAKCKQELPLDAFPERAWSRDKSLSEELVLLLIDKFHADHCLDCSPYHSNWYGFPLHKHHWTYFTRESFEARAFEEMKRKHKESIENRKNNIETAEQAILDIVNNPKTDRDNINEYVYLLQYPTGECKIGLTSSPNSRLSNFQTSCPYHLEFIALIKTHGASSLEHSLHIKFAAKRLRGEWFNLSEEDIDYIKGLQS
jgi:hypothetical protein